MSFAPTLEGARVRLRPVTRADVPALYRIFGDAKVMRYWSTPAMASMAEAEDMATRILEGYEEKAWLQLAIEKKASPGLIGTCSIFAMHVASRRAELGYILDRACWGQGLMAEALDCIVSYAFDTLGLNRLEADIDPANLASEKALLRLGFKQEGFMPERWIVGGTLSDSAVFGLLARDWHARKGHEAMCTDKPHAKGSI